VKYSISNNAIYTSDRVVIFPHIFIGKRDRKKRQQLNVIHTEAQYADEVDQQHDNGIQEALGIYVFRMRKITCRLYY
jgi:hypothetical protein